MLLVCDVGNTNIVFGLYDHQNLISHIRLLTNTNKTSDEVGSAMAQMLLRNNLTLSFIEGIVVSSVVPDMDKAIAKASIDYCKQKAMFVGVDIFAPTPLLVENPKEVGSDRIVNCFAGSRKYQQALIIVDFGTATKFDVVSVDGEFLGGAIAPGFDTSKNALFQAAAKLGRFDVYRPSTALGKTTRDAVSSGLFFGYIGLVESMLGRLKMEVPLDCKVVATGGLAGYFTESVAGIDYVDPFLTLDGLYLLYKDSIEV